MHTAERSGPNPKRKHAFKGLVDSVGEVIDKATNLADKIVEGLKVVGKVGAVFGL